MAGTVADWDKAAFQEGILLAMNMGTPNVPSEALTFVWEEVTSFADADDAGHPFDWTNAPATQDQVSELQVPAAVERGVISTTETSVGQFDDSHITITILGEEWQEVLTHSSGRAPEQVRYNGDLYSIESGPETIGLFDEDVHTLVAVRADAP